MHKDVVPELIWDLRQIKMLWHNLTHDFQRGTGRRRDILSDQRFIHSKGWFPRLVEGMVMEDGLKVPLIDKGGQRGHRADELVFVMKSLSAKYLKEKKMLIVTFYDIAKFFW